MAERARGSFLPSVAVLAGAVATAVATSEWWIVALGAVAAGATFAMRPKAVKSELPEGLDADHVRRASALLARRDELVKELAAAPAVARELLGVTEKELGDLVAKALALVKRRQEIAHFLARPTATNRAALQAQLERETDELARARLQDALAAKDASLRSHEELRRSVSRLDAELASVDAGLERLLNDLVRLRSAETRATVEHDSGRINETLRQISGDIDTIAGSVETVFSERDPASRPRERTR